jgi:hypothetical protein
MHFLRTLSHVAGLSGAAWLSTGLAVGQELRIFPLSTTSPPFVHWDATSNLGPMGAFSQSYPLGGDVVVDFDQTPSSGVARVTDARLIVPNGVVAVLLSGPNMGSVAFFELELGASTPDFTLVPGVPGATFATTLDLVAKSGSMRVEPPFGPAFDVQFANTPIGSIPISGAFPSIGPAQGFTLQPFVFDMPFTAAGWNGMFTHNVPAIQSIAGCPPPSGYCTPDPASPGGGTQLDVLGNTSVQADNFTLGITRAPVNTFGVFFHGGRRGLLPSSFGQVCVGGPLARLGVVPTDANGVASMRVILANHQSGPLALAPGAHAHFQFYHRVVTPTGAGWNYSNAVAVTFCP